MDLPDAYGFSQPRKFSRWIEELIRRQNDRCHVQCSGGVCETKFPVNVHVLAVVSNEGHIIPPHLFVEDDTVTAHVYLRVLSTVIFQLWMDRVCKRGPYVYQQDGTSAHTSRK